jgi:adenylate cyclase class 2
MKEIEVKILEIDKISIINKLISIWAVKKYEWNIEAYFYKNEDNKKIRLRKTSDWFNINFKEKIENSSFLENHEYESNFENFEMMEKILIWIWFKKYWYSSKYRISYFYDWITFDIDSYPWIPDFIEIEAESIESVEKWVKLLWYSMSYTKILTEREIKEHYLV